MPAVAHAPVLLRETIEILQPSPGDRILEVTLGLGGHARAFLEHAPNSTLVGLDADPRNLAEARTLLEPFVSRVTFLHENFAMLPTLALGAFDVIFADLGLSSPHLDDPARGFSYRFDAPLDMRFDPSVGHSAADLIAGAQKEELADILYRFGEVRRSRWLAEKIAVSRPKTTMELRACVEGAFGNHASGILPQIFQAFRIAVNNELCALETLLGAAPAMLRPCGRLAVIAYHSLEDRIVKRTFRDLTTGKKDPVTGAIAVGPEFALLTRKVIVPSEEELARNPRSRSAKLRAIRKL